MNLQELVERYGSRQLGSLDSTDIRNAINYTLDEVGKEVEKKRYDLSCRNYGETGRAVEELDNLLAIISQLKLK